MRVPRQPSRLPSPRSPEPPGTPPSPPGPGRLRRLGRLRWVACGVAFLVLCTAAAGWSCLRGLDGNIATDVTTARELARHSGERPAPAPGSAQNILVILTTAAEPAAERKRKSDSGRRQDAGRGEKAGQDPGEGRGERGGQDTSAEPAPAGGTIPAGAGAASLVLLHLADDGRRAAAVRLPRELQVEVPRCAGQDGEPVPAGRTRLDASYARGGAACTIRTLERLTGIRVDHHLIVDLGALRGVAEVLGDAHGCSLGELADRLGGEALRHPAELLPLLDSLTSSLTSDRDLDSLFELYGLVQRVRAVPRERLSVLTVPEEQGRLSQPAADSLFDALRADRPVPAEAVNPTRQPADPAVREALCG